MKCNQLETRWPRGVSAAECLPGHQSDLFVENDQPLERGSIICELMSLIYVAIMVTLSVP